MAGASSCIPALFRRRPAKLQSKLSNSHHVKQQKEMESLVSKSSNETRNNNFLLFMELRKKIMTFRDIFDIPPLSGSVPIHELLILTREDLHRMYPEFVHGVPIAKIKERNTHEGLICFYHVLKCVGDSNWIEDPNVREKFKYGNVENVPLDELAKIVVAILDCINRTAKERFDMTDEDESKKDYSSGPSSVSHSSASSRCSSMNKRSNDQGSECRYSSNCTSPHTPTSVLPESPRCGDHGSYSPSRLWDLRVQALERLSPMDWKRLSFQMVLKNNLQSQKNNEGQKANAVDDHVMKTPIIIPLENLKDDTRDEKEEVKCEEDQKRDPTPMITNKNDEEEAIQLPSSKLELKLDDQINLRTPQRARLESERTTSTPSSPMSPTIMSSFPPVKQLHSPPPPAPPPPPPKSTPLPTPPINLIIPPPPPPPPPKSTPIPTPPNNLIIPPPPPPPTLQLRHPPPPLLPQSKPIDPPLSPLQEKSIPPPPPLPPPANTVPTPPPPPPTGSAITSPPFPNSTTKAPTPQPLTFDVVALPPPPPPPPDTKAVPPNPTSPTLGVRAPPPPPPPLPPSFGEKDAPPPPSHSGATQPPPPPPASKGNVPVPPPPPGSKSNTPTPPPPPPPGSKGNAPVPPPPVPSKGGGPPPPPPGTGKSIRARNSTRLKRSSHMGSLYRLLKGKVEGSCLSAKLSQGKKGGGSNAGASAGAGGGQSMADALAEMTKRSSYFQQIEEDIEKHGKSIKEMQGALSSFQNKDMNELLTFYHQVESKLEVLTDESQVFARFEGFPIKKLEALRMAAALYKKLDAILAELHNWKIESPLAQLLDRVEKYFNKIKGELEGLERTKDEEAKKFQSHKILFDFQILVKIKEAMVDVSSGCMELALKERRDAKAATNDQNWSKSGGQKKVCAKMLWKAFQFAFKVYSFAGGQDERADNLTRELAQEIEKDPMQD